MPAIIILNGEIPNKKIIIKYINNGDHIIAADGGGNYLKSAGILPDIIIGDMDSLSESSVRYFTKRKVKIRKITEQETTDFEKCLLYCRKKNFKEIIVFGSLSLRPDHTLNNFSILKRYSDKFNVKLISEEFEILLVKKKIDFSYKKGEIISLLALPRATGIKTKGLKYELNNEKLELGIREGSSNEAVSDFVSIEYKLGSLLLFKKHFLN